VTPLTTQASSSRRSKITPTSANAGANLNPPPPASPATCTHEHAGVRQDPCCTIGNDSKTPRARSHIKTIADHCSTPRPESGLGVRLRFTCGLDDDRSVGVPLPPRSRQLGQAVVPAELDAVLDVPRLGRQERQRPLQLRHIDRQSPVALRRLLRTGTYVGGGGVSRGAEVLPG
jgi:hypothetical protein